MIPTGPATKVFLALGATDLRKGFEGLGDLVRHRLKEDPMSGHLFAFTNRNRTRIKLLYWDGSGTWLLAKRLAKGRFSWPGDEGTPTDAALRILAEELTLLLSGIDLEKTQSRAWWRKAA
ncbi:MAG: IS66 family insertion sequence element accessory protein TnpB [Verrucomicrobia bacterium]|nr:IS66 family insertion sequence element accessory protein TnpB [Verrucomicrobiota bacterium]